MRGTHPGFILVQASARNTSSRRSIASYFSATLPFQLCLNSYLYPLQCTTTVYYYAMYQTLNIVDVTGSTVIINTVINCVYMAYSLHHHPAFEEIRNSKLCQSLSDDVSYSLLPLG